MNYKLFVILLVVFLGFIFSMPVVAQKDAKAKEVLDKASVILDQAGGLSVTFTININDEINKDKHSFEGSMLMKGSKFFYDTPDQSVYYDGKTQWVYNKLFDEVSIIDPKPQDIQALNPVSTFEIYKTGCDYKYKGEKTDAQKRKVHEISLFPKDKKEDIKQIDLQINASDYMPVFFKVAYKNGLEYRIYISKYRTNLNLQDNQFVFDTKKYPNAEVNDLR